MDNEKPLPIYNLEIWALEDKLKVQIMESGFRKLRGHYFPPPYLVSTDIQLDYLNILRQEDYWSNVHVRKA